MAYRLVAHIDGRPERFSLEPGEHLLGSHPSCAVRIAQATVSRRHALVTVDACGVSIEDLGSRNGIRIGTERIAEARLAPGTEVFVGAVPVILEELPDDDLEPAVVLAEASPRAVSEADAPGGETTCAGGPVEEFAVVRLPTLLRRISGGCGVAELALMVGEALHATLPCIAVEVVDDAGQPAVLFRAEREAGRFPEPFSVTARRGHLRVDVQFPSPRVAGSYGALVDTGAELLALARGSASTPAGPSVAEPPPLPDPPTVVPRMRQIYADGARVARGEVSVLILGESGTGKEVLASYLHRASARADGPFMSLNCASLPEDLLESELFGIERGVATGVEERPGRFELASGGTLFLDEVGDMAPGTQAKILRVLQSGETYRLGAREPRRVDVRIVAATNRDIRAMIAEGSFRTDLYHRIATWVVDLPPLRQRRADIANLAAFFLARAAERRGIRVRGISRAALDALHSCGWPGNVRQLENEMERAVLFLEDGELLDTTRLDAEIRGGGSGGSNGTLAEVLERVEADEISLALSGGRATVEAAASRLGISRATLYRRMKALGIEADGS